MIMSDPDRSSWPFPALLPFHVKAYPIPQALPVAAPQTSSAWPFRMRASLARWSDATRHIRSAGNQLYVHVPFCPFFCDFCPLYKTTKGTDRGAGPRAAFVDALLSEIRLYADVPLLRDTTFDAIYFGGGTPTELCPDQIAAVLAALRASFHIPSTAEITLEGVAAQFLAPGRLAGYVGAGVNRISYGVQALDPSVRKAIGRTDKVDDCRALAARAKSEFPQLCVNADVMSGLPGQSIESFEHDIEELAEWPFDSIDVITYIMFPGSRSPPENHRRPPRSALLRRASAARAALHRPRARRARISGGDRGCVHPRGHRGVPADRARRRWKRAEYGTRSRPFFMGHDSRDGLPQHV